MAKSGLTKHRKFLRLSYLLGGDEIAARGHLEYLWDAAYESADDYVGDAWDVESVCKWRGEPGKLVKALCECGGENPGFIEAVEDRPGHYRVHDLYQNAPDYVKKRMSRRAGHIEKGESISEIRARAGRNSGQARGKNLDQTEENVAESNKRPPFVRQNQANGADHSANGADVRTNGNKNLPIQSNPIQGREEATASSCPELDFGQAPELVIPTPLPAPVQAFTCVGSGAKEWVATEADVTVWREAFPGVDIPQELKRMSAWIQANPTRRKTAKGMKAAVFHWLSNAQNRGGSRGQTQAPQRVQSPPHRQRVDDEYYETLFPSRVS